MENIVLGTKKKKHSDMSVSLHHIYSSCDTASVCSSLREFTGEEVQQQHSVERWAANRDGQLNMEERANRTCVVFLLT